MTVTRKPYKYQAQTKQQEEAITILAKLLSEAVVRISAIDNAFVRNQLMPPSLGVEFSYLQLRMLCETVALSCLVAHGDIEASQSSKLLKDYAADSIIKKLEHLHPNFYPHPITAAVNIDTIHMERISSGFLTKAELIALYHECGNRLHRGSLAKFRSTAPQAHSADISRIHEWREKLVILLKGHHIASLNNLSHYVCFLSHQQMDGKPLVMFAMSPLPE